MSTVSVRYIVDDLDAAIGFYRDDLGFEVVMHPAPTFAMLAAATCACCSASPAGGVAAARRCPTARRPEPGGWNRFQLEVADLHAEVERLRAAGARFRNEIVEGMGGDQILLEDPSGNAIELFQDTR